MKTDHAEAVAAKLIEQLQQGTAPWQKPWAPGEQRLPFNPTTGKPYRGINSMWLEMQGRGDPRWMTYKQAAAEGAQVRKGEKGTRVEYWKFRDERQATDGGGNPIFGPDGKPKMETVQLERPRMFAATVFNADQIDGLPPPEPRPVASEPERHERAESILTASGAKIRHVSGNRALYSPTQDAITMPERQQFHSADGYYATALHELGHWTGHSTRLDRDLAHPFGSEGYAREELRAEIASLMLGDELGIGHDPGQHAAYVGSWIKALKEDPREIFRAAADAEKINGYVMAFEKEQVQEQGVAAPAQIAERPDALPPQRDDLTAAPSVQATQALEATAVPEGWRGPAARIFDEEMAASTGNPDYDQAQRLASALSQYEEMSFEPSEQEQAILDERKPAMDEATQWMQENVLRNPVVKARMFETVRDFGRDTGDPAADKARHDYLAEMSATHVLPAGWAEAHPGGMATNPDPDRGGIVDTNIVSDQWFYVPSREGMAASEAIYPTRAAAFEGLAEALQPPAMTEQERIIHADIGDARRSADRWDDAGERNEVQGIADFAMKSLEHGKPKQAVAALREATGIEHRFGPPLLFREAADTLEAGQLNTLQDLIDSREQHRDAEQIARNAYLESINTREVPIMAPPAWQTPGVLTGQLGRDWARFTEFEEEVADLRAEAGAAEYYVEATDGLSDTEREAAGIKVTHRQAIRDMQDAGDALGQKQRDFERFRAERDVLLPEEKAAQERRDREREAAAPTTTQTDAMVRMPVLHEAPEAPMQGRTYLAVPFAEKDEAKAMGARWDKEQRAWYAPEGVSIEASGLDRWAAGGDGVIASQTTADPRVEFGRALREAGLQIDGLPVMDGQMQRVAVEGDRRGEKSGAYAGHLTGQTPGGYIKNHKSGETVNWKSSTVQSTLGAQQRATLNAEAAMRRQQRMDQREEQQERAAQLANSFFNEADPADPSNAYAVKKDMTVAGLRQVPPAETGMTAPGIHIAKTPGEAKKLRETHPDDKVFLAGDLLVPARDFDGKLWSLQSVNPTFKSFMKGGRKHGLHALAGTDKPFNQSELATDKELPLIVAEGYATADTLANSLRHPVVVAFDSGNLQAVAEQLRERYPERAIFIAGDNDHAREGEIDTQTGKPKVNVGKEKAIEAAAAVAGATLLPQFAQGEKGSDWNDRRQQHGSDAVRQELIGAIAVASVQSAAIAQGKAEEARKQEQGIRQEAKAPGARVSRENDGYAIHGLPSPFPKPAAINAAQVKAEDAAKPVAAAKRGRRGQGVEI